MTWLVIKWLLLIFPSLFIAVFARLLCPILPLFASEDGWLPSWLWWFQTPFDSLDGDSGSWERNPGTDAWSTYVRRVCWLWRNSGYGFDMRVCGVKVNPDTDTIVSMRVIRTSGITAGSQVSVSGSRIRARLMKL